MPSTNWREYVDSNIKKFREDFARLNIVQKEIAENASSSVYSFTFLAPIQVVLVEISDYPVVIIVLLHKPSLPDKAIVIIENVPSFELQKRLLKEPLSPRWLTTEALNDIGNNFSQMLPSLLKERYQNSAIGLPEANGSMWIFPKDSLKLPATLSKTFLDDMIDGVTDILKAEELQEMGKTVKSISEEVETIQAPLLRDKMLESMQKLQDHIRKIEEIDSRQEKIENDLSGVHRLMGTKTFGDWKLLGTEIDNLRVRIDSLYQIQQAYDKVLAQQAEVMKQQSSFITWIKYATILVPIAVLLSPILDILIRYLLRI